MSKPLLNLSLLSLVSPGCQIQTKLLALGDNAEDGS